MTKIKTFLILSLLILSHYSMARNFIDGEIKVEMSYSNIDSKTIDVGEVTAKIRRTDDHFACLIVVGNVDYACESSDAVDNLTWIQLSSNEYTKILLSGINPAVSPEMIARIKTLLDNKLTSFLIVTGHGEINFKDSEELFEADTPDVLKITVKAR